MTDRNATSPLMLLPWIGTPDCPAIADIRTEDDFAADPWLIPGSFRHPHGDLPGLAARIGSRSCVVVCQKGKKISQGAAAWLRTGGAAATVLAGGTHGWRDTPGAPRITAAALPGAAAQPTQWVTGARPGSAAIAGAWLIRRLIDRDARLLFVAPAEVAAVSAIFGAESFGSNSFADQLDAIGLGTEPLCRLARQVDGTPDAPETAGLHAVMAGLAGCHADDLDLIEAALPVLDALYRAAHDVPAGGAA